MHSRTRDHSLPSIHTVLSQATCAFRPSSALSHSSSFSSLGSSSASSSSHRASSEGSSSSSLPPRVKTQSRRVRRSKSTPLTRIPRQPPDFDDDWSMTTIDRRTLSAPSSSPPCRSSFALPNIFESDLELEIVDSDTKRCRSCSPANDDCEECSLSWAPMTLARIRNGKQGSRHKSAKFVSVEDGGGKVNRRVVDGEARSTGGRSVAQMLRWLDLRCFQPRCRTRSAL